VSAHPVVHLELHTGAPPCATAFYAQLLQWRSQRIEAASGSYLALDVGRGVDGGVVRCPAQRAVWLPYVAVDRIDEITERAGRLGASVLLEPREGPTGWRSVVATPAGGDIAFWQAKR
jgi:predicted enzyme related to lactoylglutathione lyase